MESSSCDSHDTKIRVIAITVKKMLRLIKKECLFLNEEQAKKSYIVSLLNDKSCSNRTAKDVMLLDSAINFKINIQEDNCKQQIFEQRIRHKMIYPKLLH